MQMLVSCSLAQGRIHGSIICVWVGSWTGALTQINYPFSSNISLCKKSELITDGPTARHSLHATKNCLIALYLLWSTTTTNALTKKLPTTTYLVTVITKHVLVTFLLQNAIQNGGGGDDNEEQAPIEEEQQQQQQHHHQHHHQPPQHQQQNRHHHPLDADMDRVFGGEEEDDDDEEEAEFEMLEDEENEGAQEGGAVQVGQQILSSGYRLKELFVSPSVICRPISLCFQTDLCIFSWTLDERFRLTGGVPRACSSSINKNSALYLNR